MTLKTKKILAELTALFVPLFALLIFLLKDSLINLSFNFPKCDFHQKTGYLCPACGNTRSVQSLLSGKIFTSLGYNITPFVVVCLVLAFYIEVVAFVFGKKLRIIPRNYLFLAITLTFLIIYYIARNFVPFLTLC